MEKYVKIRYGNRISYGIEQGEEIKLLEGSSFDTFSASGICIPKSNVEEYLPPFEKDRKILGIGRNYNRPEFTPADIPVVPKVFLKSSGAMIRDGEAIVITPMNADVIAEPEIAFMISKHCVRVSEAEAMDYVGGYLVVNDVTDRALLKEDGGEWTRGKSTDTFLPIGNAIIAGIDPFDLKVSCEVNGVERASGKTGDMIFPIPRLVSFISHFMTLEAGDIIMTGTPRGPEIRDGDVVKILVENVGEITNPVVFCRDNWKI